MAIKTVQYTRLLQSAPSDEEDEPPQFDSVSDETTGRKQEHIELGDLMPYPLSNGNRQGAVHRKRWSQRQYWTSVVLIVVFVLVMATAVAVTVTYMSQQFNHSIVHDIHTSSRREWAVVFNNSVSGKAVTLVDVDGDQLEDVLVGITDVNLAITAHTFPGLTVKQTCIKRGNTYPCLSQVIALRGYDGKELWKTWLSSEVIFSNCINIDVNNDSKPDCVFSGRESTLQAVDLATGNIHWVIDAEDGMWSSHFVPGWLVCRALSVPDVDGDGILDFLITHGGNFSKKPEDHERAPGRVIIVSGATGQPLGRYLDLPNSRETYMSPVRHLTANGTAYILLGSGGEMISGDLMIISYEDLLQYMIGNSPASLRTIFSGTEKGVMLSPVLADVTRDGTADILVTAFEGILALYDGETLQEIWIREFPGMETYCVAAPGHYDDDGVLDFMVTWVYGVWDTYDYGIAYVVSGDDGAILWQARSQVIRPISVSGLTLKTTTSQDLFIFRSNTGKKAHTAVTASSGGIGRRRERHGDHDDDDDDDDHFTTKDGSLESFYKMCDKRRRHYLDKYGVSCSSNFTDLKEDVLLMDRANTHSPVVVSTNVPQAYYYTEPVNEHGRNCHNQSSSNKLNVDMCVVRKILSFTGAVGDVDGNGVADFIDMQGTTATLINDHYSYKKIEGNFVKETGIVVSRISLAPFLRPKAALLPMTDQPWRQYMGSSGDSVYREPNRRSL